MDSCDSASYLCIVDEGRKSTSSFNRVLTVMPNTTLPIRRLALGEVIRCRCRYTMLATSSD